MKKFITLLLSVFLLTNMAIAVSDMDSLKQDVSNSLNSTVATLKEYFKKTNEKLIENKLMVDNAKETAQALKEASLEKETNPVVLKHGLAAMPTCDTATQELAWSGDHWICVKPTYGTDCYPAKDEYRYEQADGSIICSKSAQGQALDYYWKFRGHYPHCGSDARRAKIYSCYYTNKLGVEVEVADTNCASKTKPNANEYVCYANWSVGGWGACQADTKRYRSVSCPANHVCSGAQPATSEICWANWKIGQWNRCNASCPGTFYRKRLVSCPANHACHGPKPESQKHCSYQGSCAYLG